MRDKNGKDNDLLLVKQVTEEYGPPAGTLRSWRCRGIGPPSFTLGPKGRVVYRRGDLEAWLAKVEQETRRGDANVTT
jgi:hypothetical protein